MAADYDVLSELEVLQSIYLDELQFASSGDGWEVSLLLYPSTAEDSVSQFVRLTLKLTLDQQYPSSSPSVSIHNPRGLSDDLLSSVCSSLREEAESCLGSPVLYQLIEKAKEILTESNIPHGNCVICLYGFKEGEAFTKTSCYHHFHSHCLGRYVTHSEEELVRRRREHEQDKTRHCADQQELAVVCPVCREPLTYDAGQLLSSPPPAFPQQEATDTGSDFRQKWRELQELLERQKANGGVIDPHAESNRFLLHINQVPSPSEGETGASLAIQPPDPAHTRPPPAPGPGRGGGGAGPRRPFRGPRRGGRGRPHPSPPADGLYRLRLRPDAGPRPPPSPAPARPGGGPKADDPETTPAAAASAVTDRQGPGAAPAQPEPPDHLDKPPGGGGRPGPPGGPDAAGRRRGGDQHPADHRHQRPARGTTQWDPQGARPPPRGPGGRDVGREGGL